MTTVYDHMKNIRKQARDIADMEEDNLSAHLDAMVEAGWLEKRGDNYVTTPAGLKAVEEQYGKEYLEAARLVHAGKDTPDN